MMNTEVLCWCLLAAAVLIFICVIGFGGKLGNAFGDLLFGIMGMKIEHDAGYYECPNCGERYVPSMLAVLLAIHVGTARRLKCPYCEKRGFHKKVVSKKKG